MDYLHVRLSNGFVCKFSGLCSIAPATKKNRVSSSGFLSFSHPLPHPYFDAHYEMGHTVKKIITTLAKIKPHINFPFSAIVSPRQ